MVSEPQLGACHCPDLTWIPLFDISGVEKVHCFLLTLCFPSWSWGFFSFPPYVAICAVQTWLCFTQVILGFISLGNQGIAWSAISSPLTCCHPDFISDFVFFSLSFLLHLNASSVFSRDIFLFYWYSFLLSSSSRFLAVVSHYLPTNYGFYIQISVQFAISCNFWF